MSQSPSRGPRTATGLATDPAVLVDQFAVTHLIQAWAMLRDSGDWEELAATFHPEGQIAVSWFHGSFNDFIAMLRNRTRRTFAKHVMGGSRIVVRGNRALAETDAQLFTRGVIDGVEFTTHTLIRFLDRIERREGAIWRILDRVAVYDHDMLVPALPDRPPVIPMMEIQGLDPAYRFLAWHLRRAKLPVPDRLPTGGSDMERDLRDADAAWFNPG